MIVKFFCKNSADVIMFDDVACQLLAVLGKAPTARGIILPEEITESLARLAALAAGEARPRERAEAVPEAAVEEAPEVGVEPHDRVGLAVRAQPLIHMLGRAREKDAPVLWEAPRDFYPPPPGGAVNCAPAEY